jgi:hypothetical protein
MAGNTVTLRFVGDTRDIQRSFNVVGAAAGKTESRFSQFSSTVKTLAATAGTAIALKFGRDSVNAFKEAEAAQSRLQNAFEKFPRLAGTNIESLRKLNTELAKTTRFDDDATASAQAVLAQFNLTGKQLKVLTPLVQDYAAKTGKDLTTAAKDVGRALQGKGRALQAVGLNLKDAKDATANYNQVVDGLRAKVGGFAEKEGKTASGRSEILKNQFQELQETVGEKLVPALQKLTDWLLKVIEKFEALPDWVQKAIGVALGLAAALVIVTKATQAFTAAQVALDVVLGANPVVLITLAVIALGAALYLAYTKSETFRNIVDSAFDVVQGAVEGVVDAVKTLVDWFKKAWEWGSKVADMAGKIPGVKTGAKSLAKTLIPGLGFLPGFAQGGTVPGPIGAPMVAVVHGGEHVTPVGGSGPSGGAMTVNVYMPPGSDGNDVIDAIQRYERRNGKGWRSA